MNRPLPDVQAPSYLPLISTVNDMQYGIVLYAGTVIHDHRGAVPCQSTAGRN